MDTPVRRHGLSNIRKNLPPLVPAAVLISLVPLIYNLWTQIRGGYELFLSLGSGGTPPTLIGYFKVSLLRLLLARSDVYTAPRPQPPFDTPMPYFSSPLALAVRESPRPQLAGIAPQRQISQRASEYQVTELANSLRALAAANRGTIITGKSCFEKESLALFLDDRTGVKGTVDGSEARREEVERCVGILHNTCGRPPEVAHMHGSEGSLHLTLHPEDAACVIERGWGERHPLAGAGGFLRDLVTKGPSALWQKRSEGWLPRGFVLVYAPRTKGERAVVGEIVKAGALWVGGVKLKGADGGESEEAVKEEPRT